MIENGSARDRHDVDIGGAPYMVMVENLEKGISPFTMMEFIHDQLSIPCQVTVSPWKSWESYTRGIITVDSKKKLDKISEFLETPDHSIISSKGRPWVITEKKLVHDMSLASIQAFLANYQLETSLSRGSLALSSVVEGMSTFSNHQRISCEAAYDLKNRRKDTSPSRGSLALSCYVEGMSDNPSDMGGRDDMDIGGVPYMVIVENLEKGISPFTIMEFIHHRVSITCQASVSPSKSSESYTCGIILLDSKKNLGKLSDFLESPDHIIISYTGRPWLMTEKRPVPETLRASIQAFILVSQTALESRSVSSNELDVVISGSREYMKAKELKNLFKEFSKHQCGLHRRLLLEEEKISQIYM